MLVLPLFDMDEHLAIGLNLYDNRADANLCPVDLLPALLLPVLPIDIDNFKVQHSWRGEQLDLYLLD